MKLRLEASRPLVLAIGPTAAAELNTGHRDLGLVDVVVLEGDPLRRVIDKLGMLEHLLLENRAAVVCLFDSRDEAWWPVVSRVSRTVRKTVSVPLMFVCSDPRPRQSDRGAMLGRLARHLDACVIEAPQEPDGLLRAGMLPIVGLIRLGLSGFDNADLAVMTRPPSVGHTAFAISERLLADEEEWNRVAAVLQEPGVSHVLIMIECDANTGLGEINAIYSRVTEVVPNVEVLLATPAFDPERCDDLQVERISLGVFSCERIG